jgi:hypothetical protein
VAKGLARSGFDIDLAYGQANEAKLRNILWLEGNLIEVKADGWAVRTGNVFVEYRQHGRNSGISVTTAHWWAFHLVGLDTWALVATPRLKELARLSLSRFGPKFAGDNDKYEGALVPVHWLVSSTATPAPNFSKPSNTGYEQETLFG